MVEVYLVLEPFIIVNSRKYNYCIRMRFEDVPVSI